MYVGIRASVSLFSSEAHPLAATDFYSVLDTSDVPGGVVNVLTGAKDALARVLAEHDDVDAVWYWGSHEGARRVELASAGNMKQTWAHWAPRDWMDARGALRVEIPGEAPFFNINTPADLDAARRRLAEGPQWT